MQSSFLFVYVRKSFPFFFDGVAAKRTKNGVWRGAAPNPGRFLKKATQKLS
ncbi:MAG: hypothetical protein IKB28_03615 [Clostridia bacterium]|nr:hypothetical protein [Clostridia bacterium]